MTARATKKALRPVPDGWMSGREVARRLGIARPTVASLALRGRLEYQLSAGRTVYSRASVERLEREQRKSA